MAVNAVTHLNFRGDARQALDFYHAVFGGTIVLTTYGDFGAPQDTPLAGQVVWGQVAADSGFRVMAYDCHSPSRPRRRASRRRGGSTG